jgi:hypothetical protein
MPMQLRQMVLACSSTRLGSFKVTPITQSRRKKTSSTKGIRRSLIFFRMAFSPWLKVLFRCPLLAVHLHTPYWYKNCRPCCQAFSGIFQQRTCRAALHFSV